MKALTVLFSLLWILMPVSQAQTVDEMLGKVSSAIEAGKERPAVSYFRQAIELDINRSEMYYWVDIDKNADYCEDFANELAVAFKRNRNFDKAYLFYAMLIKNFDFQSRFDMLENGTFANSQEQIPYFGIDKKSRDTLYDKVHVLFYNNPFDYAVSLNSDKDEVILYRTSTKKDFLSLYNILEQKSKKFKGNKAFVAGDQLKVPYMSIKQDTSYDVLCGKEIANTDRLYIDKALQTVQFNMNNKGVKLKSEAVMNIMTMSMPIMVAENGRNFFFNDTFVLFMKEKDKSMPYFAIRVKDMSSFKYTGEIK